MGGEKSGFASMDPKRLKEVSTKGGRHPKKKKHSQDGEKAEDGKLLLPEEATEGLEFSSFNVC